MIADSLRVTLAGNFRADGDAQWRAETTEIARRTHSALRLGRHASITTLATYAVIPLANGIAAAQRIAITQNASPPSDA
jgi:hypothetical protein